VVQGAVVLYLEPIFEVDFEDNVYAYRPERSAHDALGEVSRRLYEGQKHVVDADVEKYFDTIPHSDLLKSVARRIADGKVLHLLKLWLKSPVEEREEGGKPRRTGGKKSKQGIPPGRCGLASAGEPLHQPSAASLAGDRAKPAAGTDYFLCR
jgi:RNA-directed DNA polymerase